MPYHITTIPYYHNSVERPTSLSRPIQEPGQQLQFGNGNGKRGLDTTISIKGPDKPMGRPGDRAKDFKQNHENPRTLYISSWLISAYVIGVFWLGHGSYNSARLEPDTDYLRWTTRLPAVSVCQAAAFSSSSLHFKNKEEFDFMHGLVRPRTLMCRKCNNISSKFKSADLGQLALKVVASCQDLFSHCSFNGKLFDCCERFGQLKTKRGICYSINSEMTQNDFKISVSHFARDAALHFSVNFPAQVFIHDSKEVLFLSSKAPVVDPGSSLSLLYRTRETVVDQSARELTIQQRSCVVEGERSVQGYPAYSRSSCRVACLAQAQTAVCGCRHHLLPGNSSYCDFSGLQCLDHHFREGIKTQRNLELYRKCNCLPSCDQQDVKVIYGQLKRNESQTSINIQLIAPPTERLVLKSKVEFLDVLVAFACFTRLFTSTSVLDIIRAAPTWIYPRKTCVSYRHIFY